MWHLMQGEALLGILTLSYTDQPFYFCTFEPTASYQIAKPFFERELAFLNADDMESWESAYDAIDKLGLCLKDIEENVVITEFILHIEADEAWFRY
jgi:hypothetical protein